MCVSLKCASPLLKVLVSKKSQLIKLSEALKVAGGAAAAGESGVRWRRAEAVGEGGS